MDGQQHIKSSGAEGIGPKLRIALRINPDCGTTVVSVYEG